MLMKKTVENIAAEKSEDGIAVRLKNGCGGCEVFKILYKGSEAVIKLGVNELGRSEIGNNLASYSEMKEFGVSKIVAPEIFAKDERGEFPYIILEYLGTDFRKRATQENIMGMTRVLVDGLDAAYTTSICKDPVASQKWLEERKQDIIRYFTVYLIPSGFGSKEDVLTLQKLEMKKIAPEYVTWATRDLTPDNIFINGKRLTVIDSKSGSRGMPLLDVAMFATLAGEVYNLPNGIESAGLARNFASRIGEEMLKTDYSKELFEFGEIFQYSLSVRFRKDKDPRSSTFVESIRNNLDDILTAMRK